MRIDRAMKTYCYALDLKDDPALIAEYRRYHTMEGIWPEVVDFIRSTGMMRERIFLLGTRMVMVLDAEDDFSPEEAAAGAAQSSTMQRWETLMDNFQQRLPQAKEGQKWVPMELIFDVER